MTCDHGRETVVRTGFPRLNRRPYGRDHGAQEHGNSGGDGRGVSRFPWYRLEDDRPHRAKRGREAAVEKYRFDRDHNSPFRLARSILDRSAPVGGPDAARLAEVKKELESDDPPAQRRALETLKKLDTPTRQAALAVVFKLAGQAKDQGVRDAAAGIIRSDFGPVAYPAAEVEEIRKVSECRPTGTSSHPQQADGHLRLTVRVAANGCNFVVIKRDEVQPKGVGPDR